ncbi:28815_t:CDS:2, partial [Gigaspora margarita]
SRRETKDYKIMKHTGKRISKKGLRAITEYAALIVVPTTEKNTQKVKATKLRTPRTPLSKASTCAYYDCLIDLVSAPENNRTKITELTKKCKCSKEEVAKTKAQLKHKLIHELAKNYKEIAELKRGVKN